MTSLAQIVAAVALLASAPGAVESAPDAGMPAPDASPADAPTPATAPDKPVEVGVACPPDEGAPEVDADESRPQWRQVTAGAGRS
jgi:hypothetical protein